MPHPLRLTVMVACKVRTAFLYTALPAWRRLLHLLNDEILVLDWDITVPEHVRPAEIIRALPRADNLGVRVFG